MLVVRFLLCKILIPLQAINLYSSDCVVTPEHSLRQSWTIEFYAHQNPPASFGEARVSGPDSLLSSGHLFQFNERQISKKRFVGTTRVKCTVHGFLVHCLGLPS